LDLGYVKRREVRRVAEEMIAGGVDIIQLRAKERALSEVSRIATELYGVTEQAGVSLIINDHAEVAREVSVEGVHVGQDDLAVARVREIAGRDCIVGKSTHSLLQAQRAAAEGADYIGFGPLFATPTKPDYTPIGLEGIHEVQASVELPIFCIGGIKLENLADVIAAGARRVVIVSGLLQASDIAEYARAASALLNRKSQIANRK
jgi:thiamine-phosphate pyrophosphorylase